ncbi:MAG: hypothetical protein OEZ01_13170 [Candidatus Heimdallarchaeota archaeon]|nr:hypothetical protein [Candidatus Heimdallarchaeota archaeon]
MICKSCRATFVRFPCPSCGANEEIKVEEGLDESMVRPSELKGGSAVNPNFSAELDVDIESVDGVKQVLVTPSSKTTEKPSFKDRYDQISRDQEFKNEVIEVKNKVATTETSKAVNESDDEYKKRVSETLQEVMFLLEKLIE